MAKQRLTFSLNPEMPTKDGSENADDFLTQSEGGIINKKPPALYPATSYPAKSRGGITGSGNSFTVYIKKSGQGVPVCFKMRQAYWEPWDGPELNSTHPWVDLNGDCVFKQTEEKGGFVEFDKTTPGGGYGLLWISTISEEERPTIPNQEIYLNISSTLSDINNDSWMNFFLIDESGERKDLIFASPIGAAIIPLLPAHNNPVWIGDNNGKEPIDLAPLTGKIKSIQYEAHLTLGAHGFFQSEFINFK